MLRPKKVREQKAAAPAHLIDLGKKAQLEALSTNGENLELVKEFNRQAKDLGLTSILLREDKDGWK